MRSTGPHHQPGNPRLMMRSVGEWRRRVALGWHRVIRRRQCGVRCGTIVDPSGGQSFWRSRHVAPPPPPPQGTQLDVVTERSVPPPPLPPPRRLSELNKRPRPLSPPCTQLDMVTERSETPPPLPPPCTQLDVVTERSVPPPPLPPPRRLSERSEPPRPLSPPRRAEQARLADAVMQNLFEIAFFEAFFSPARAARPEEAADPAPRGPGVYLTEAYSSDGRVFEV